MRITKILLALVIVLTASCDKNENAEAIALLAGHWHVWDFEPAANSPIDDSILAKEVILKLVDIGCDPIEFTFKTDAKVSYRTGMRYLNASSDETGVNVTCAPTYDNKSGTFDFDYEMLTLNYNSGTVELNAQIEGEYLTTLVDDLVINGVTLSGKLYFIREANQLP